MTTDLRRQASPSDRPSRLSKPTLMALMATIQVQQIILPQLGPNAPDQCNADFDAMAAALAERAIAAWSVRSLGAALKRPLLLRFCCKSPKSLGTNFLVKKMRLVPSPINRSPSSLPKSPVSLPPENEVPQISFQKSHQQPRKILVCSGKGLLQQNRFDSGLQSGQLPVEPEATPIHRFDPNSGS